MNALRFKDVSRRVIVALIALSIGACVLFGGDGRPSPAELFRRTLANVDRFVIMPPSGGIRGVQEDETVPLFEIRGREVVASLVESVEFTGDFEQVCLCDGFAKLEFFQGQHFKMALTFHHFSRLRGEDAPWVADATLTDKGRDRLLAWFTAQGFAMFEKDYRDMKAKEAERAERFARWSELFPEPARAILASAYSDGGLYRRAEEARLASMFPDKTTMILTCWRALGESSMMTWEGGDGHLLMSSSSLGRFLCTVLESANESDFEKAFAHLDPSDRKTCLGALRHLIRDAESPAVRAAGGARLARLSAMYRETQNPWHLRFVARLLGENPTPETSAELLEIARTGRPRPNNTNDDFVLSFLPDWLEAAYDLLERNDRSVLPVLEQKLVGTPPGNDRLALEIALASLDETQVIRPEHFSCAYDEPANLAWKLLLARTKDKPSIELLVAAAQSPGYVPSKEATVRLERLGVTPLKTREPGTEEDTAKKIDHGLHGRDAIDAITVLLPTTKVSERHPLFTRRAAEWMSLGDFDEARRDLIRARDVRDRKAAAFIAQTLGRFREAEVHLMYAVDSAKGDAELAAILERRGFFEFARGEFSEAARHFSASRVLRDNDRALVFEHLALLRETDARHSGLWKWTRPKWIGLDLKPVAKADDEMGATEAVILFLQGKLDEAAMLAAAAKSQADEAVSPLCEAHFTLSDVCRTKGDTAGERTHLDAAIATKAYTTQAWSLASLRLRALEDEAGADTEAGSAGASK